MVVAIIYKVVNGYQLLVVVPQGSIPINIMILKDLYEHIQALLTVANRYKKGTPSYGVKGPCYIVTLP